MIQSLARRRWGPCSLDAAPIGRTTIASGVSARSASGQVMSSRNAGEVMRGFAAGVTEACPAQAVSSKHASAHRRANRVIGEPYDRMRAAIARASIRARSPAMPPTDHPADQLFTALRVPSPQSPSMQPASRSGCGRSALRNKPETKARQRWQMFQRGRVVGFTAPRGSHCANGLARCGVARPAETHVAASCGNRLARFAGMAIGVSSGSMKRPDSSLLALAALSSLALLGCADDPPKPTEVRSRISSDLGNVLRETNAAFASSTDGLPGGAALAMLDQALGTSSLGVSAHTMAASLVAPGPHADPASRDPVAGDAQIAQPNDKLFTDANHIGDGVYQVPASLVCSKPTIDSTGHEVKTIDAKCADALAKADLRIRVAHEGDALVFAIQVDANHDEPLRFTLTHTSLAITVDLDGTQRAIVALAAIFD